MLKSSKINLDSKLSSLEKPKSFPNLDYYNQSSAVYSSKIEGNSLDLNSFLNPNSTSKIKEWTEIEDLLTAYRFAQKVEFNQINFLKAHEILSKTFLIKEKRGIYRNEPIGVFSSSGLVYMAIEANKLKSEMSKLFQEIETLQKKDLETLEIFYFASLIHLKLAHLHPFSDGNGRIARLCEKWFLSNFLQEKAWWLKTEEYYWKNREIYYQNLNLGLNYYELDYSKSLPFLTMLIKAV